MKLRACYVEWVDSAAQRGWRDPSDVDDSLMVCLTVGWLLRRTKRAVVVAAHVSVDGGIHGPMTIPTCAITKFRFIQVRGK